MIFYSPTGMPFNVPRGLENDFLKRGYRSTPPIATVQAQPQSQNSKPPENLPKVKINLVPLKELVEGLGLSTEQAKKVQNSRPLANVEDAIAKIPDVNWLGLDSLIDYAK